MITTIDRNEPNGLGIITDAEHAECEVANIFIANAPEYAVLCEIGFTDQAGHDTILRLKHERGGRLVITAQGRGEAVIILP